MNEVLIEALRELFQEQGLIELEESRREEYRNEDMEPSWNGRVEEPEYLDSSRVTRLAERYFRELAKEINSYLVNEGVCPEYGALDFGDIKLKKLKERDAESGEGTVLGYYSPETDVIGLNEGLEDWEVRKVLRHEMIHYVQGRLGLIDKYVREYGEKAGKEKIEQACQAMEYMVSEHSQPGKYALAA